MQFVANIGSVVVYFLFLIVYGALYTLTPGDMVYVFLNLAPHWGYWFMVMFGVGVAVLPDIVIKWFRQSLDPADWQILRERHFLDKKYNKQDDLATGVFDVFASAKKLPMKHGSAGHLQIPATGSPYLHDVEVMDDGGAL